ncbi:hypothetical protein BDZ89DRAFT_1075260 [Hymenopellis radicata]|nr:hypothetical protein BDZ89DRAFT_1075260 [Hymenopellis radicata]
MDLGYSTKLHVLLPGDGDADLTAFGFMDALGCLGDGTCTSILILPQRAAALPVLPSHCEILTAVATTSSEQDLDATVQLYVETT